MARTPSLPATGMHGTTKPRRRLWRWSAGRAVTAATAVILPPFTALATPPAAVDGPDPGRGAEHELDRQGRLHRRGRARHAARPRRQARSPATRAPRDLSARATMVRKKVEAALEHQLTAILCVGETLAERDAGRRSRSSRQVDAALRGLGKMPGGLTRLRAGLGDRHRTRRDATRRGGARRDPRPAARSRVCPPRTSRSLYGSVAGQRRRPHGRARHRRRSSVARA
jgi:hypothetical protein